MRELHARHHRPDERISVGFGPHSVYDLDADLLRLIVGAAAELDAVVHIHLEETTEERQVVLDRDGRSATQVLADVGALDGQLVAAHGVWLDDHDRRLLGEAGASLAHCPNSNLKLGAGIADIRAMADAGINVTIATDGPASGDSLDLWRGVSLATGLARGMRHDPQALGVDDVLLMATANGGRAIGQPDVGTLTVGSRADFIRIDIDQPTFTPSLDEHELLTHLVFANRGGNVTDVWVDGEQVVADRRPVRVDLDEAMREVVQRSSSGSGAPARL
ncbi:MAG: amidohydrolase family protein [Acidimicrobiales bacterium]